MNLGELIMIQKVITGKTQKWSTVHKFGEITTSITINKNPDTKDIWFTITGYSKNIRSPETEIFALILNHIIKEKIDHATAFTPKSSEVKKNT